MSAFSSRFPDGFQTAGLCAGIVLAVMGVTAAVWHWINNWRSNRGKRSLKLEPFHIIVLGVAVAAAGVGIAGSGIWWQIYKGSAPSASDLHAPTVDTPQRYTASELARRQDAAAKISESLNGPLTNALSLGVEASDSVRANIHRPQTTAGKLQVFRDDLVRALGELQSAIAFNKDYDPAYNPADWKNTEIVEGTDRFLMQIRGWPELDPAQAEARQRALGRDPEFSRWVDQMRSFTDWIQKKKDLISAVRSKYEAAQVYGK